MSDNATEYRVTVHYGESDATRASTYVCDVRIDWSHPDYYLEERHPSGEGPWRRSALRTRDVRSDRLDVDLLELLELEDGDWLEVA